MLDDGPGLGLCSSPGAFGSCFSAITSLLMTQQSKLESLYTGSYDSGRYDPDSRSSPGLASRWKPVRLALTVICTCDRCV